MRYPEGHGKIEKFNQTLKDNLLRGLCVDPTIDPACEALEYRIEHYLNNIYNVGSHDSLNKLSPNDAWEQDLGVTWLEDGRHDPDSQKKEICHGKSTFGNVIGVAAKMGVYEDNLMEGFDGGRGSLR